MNSVSRVWKETKHKRPDYEKLTNDCLFKVAVTIASTRHVIKVLSMYVRTYILVKLRMYVRT